MKPVYERSKSPADRSTASEVTAVLGITLDDHMPCWRIRRAHSNQCKSFSSAISKDAFTTLKAVQRLWVQYGATMSQLTGRRRPTPVLAQHCKLVSPWMGLRAAEDDRAGQVIASTTSTAAAV